VREEHPGAGEQAVAFQGEDLRVAVDVGRDHAATHVRQDGI
jgi:hypothetical protein